MADKQENPYAGETETTPEQLAQLARLVDQQCEAARVVERCETELKKAQEKLRKLEEHDVPDLMLQCGVKTLSTTGGTSVRLREVVRASMPKDPDKKKIAFDWLTENGHEGLIKHQFIISFGKNDEAWAKKFESDLLKRKKTLDFKRKDDIHNQTLCAFLREQLEEGAEVPLQAFGAFIQKFAEIERDD